MIISYDYDARELRWNSLATSEIEKELADLRELFEKIFCIPATSEPVERVFSRSEYTFMQPHCAVLAWATSYMY